MRGWKLVPIDPTPEMIEASMIRYELHERCGPGTLKVRGSRAWDAMLAAVPEPPALEVVTCADCGATLEQIGPNKYQHPGCCRGCVPISDDGRSVFIDGIGEVALAREPA